MGAIKAPKAPKAPAPMATPEVGEDAGDELRRRQKRKKGYARTLLTGTATPGSKKTVLG